MGSGEWLLYSGLAGMIAIFAVFLLHYFFSIPLVYLFLIIGLLMVAVGYIGTKIVMKKGSGKSQKYIGIFSVGMTFFIITMLISRVLLAKN